VGERVLEQPAIAEAVAQTQFESIKLLRQRHHEAAADLFAMALDDADGFRSVVLTHGDACLSHRVDREGEQRRWRT
jgi:aminoglycoside phosphotransferase